MNIKSHEIEDLKIKRDNPYWTIPFLIFSGTRVEHHNIFKIRCEIPLGGGRIRTPPEKLRDFADAQPAARPTDSKTRILKIRIGNIINTLNLFQFFIVFLVSFGTVWKYLTLTGTTWAPSIQGIKGAMRNCNSLPFL